MTPAELALAIMLLCGYGEGDRAIACRDFMVNCAVDPKGEISEEKMLKCAEQFEKQ